MRYHPGVRCLALVLSLLFAFGCKETKPGESEAEARTEAVADDAIEISIVGTNDVHGQIGRLPILAGYYRVLRETRDAVVAVDAGDMFQGTLSSNLEEGAPVVAIYDAMGVAAAAIGNHEFDFGPVGPEVVADEPGDDPRGALLARAAQADYAFLAANIVDAKTGAPVAWPGVQPSTVVDAAGVKVGLIGVTTTDTTHTTLAANVADLRIAPLADSIAAEARKLRGQGAAVVVVLAHAGAVCKEVDDPADASSCDDGEIFRAARALPEGLVDVIVAGHTHAAVAHEINGIAIIESYSKATAFGRVDLEVAGGAVRDVTIFPPRSLCTNHRAGPDECVTGTYEGRAVEPDAEVAKLVDAALERTRALRERSLGVTAKAPITRSRAHESALGNLFTDLMLAARPKADVAITNGGGLRADLPAGDLSYEELYEATPFDNRFAFVRLTAGQLAAVLAANLESDSGVLSLGGVRAVARCDGGELTVELRRRGKRLGPKTPLWVATSDFLASGGDGLFAEAGIAEDAITFEDGPTIRDAMAEVLEARGGTLHPKELLPRGERRFSYPGERPVSCKP